MKVVNNMGETDRLIRTVIAIGLIGLALTGAITGVVAVTAAVFGLVLLATAALSFCPLYTPFGIATARTRRTS